MGCSEEDVKIDYDKIIRGLKKENKQLKSQVEYDKKTVEKLNSDIWEQADKLRSKNSIISDLQEKVEDLQKERLWDKNETINRFEDIIMALITKENPVLKRQLNDLRKKF